MNWDNKMLSMQGGKITQGGRIGSLATSQPASGVKGSGGADRQLAEHDPALCPGGHEGQ